MDPVPKAGIVYVGLGWGRESRGVTWDPAMPFLLTKDTYSNSFYDFPGVQILNDILVYLGAGLSSVFQTSL